MSTLSESLPDGSIVNCEISVISFLDAGGTLRFKTSVDGNPNIAQALGLIQLAGISLFNSYMETEEEEEEEEDDR
jgi:hypothetical protein